MLTDRLRRKHLEMGIYRKKIYAAYFDATNASMEPDDCVREGITAGALSILSNRSIELRGLDQQELSREVWEKLRPNILELHRVEPFIRRCNQVIAVVTRLVTDCAFEFWKRYGVRA
jgi:hypothetical protein